MVYQRSPTDGIEQLLHRILTHVNMVQSGVISDANVITLEQSLSPALISICIYFSVLQMLASSAQSDKNVT